MLCERGPFVNIYHDMKNYFVGKSPEGDDRFRVPLKADDDGLLGRECPNEECQPKYFKMSLIIPGGISKTIENFSQIDVTCPYCGTVDNMQSFHTESQVEWIKSIMFRNIKKTFQDNLRESFRSTSPKTKGMISSNLTFKPSPLHSVRHYVEEQLKNSIECDNCGYKYTVYGISFHCPLCGKGTLTQHLRQSADTIKILIKQSERISKEKGKEVGRQMINNALEDVVGLFEGYLKHIYIYKIKHRFPKEKIETMIKKIQTNFQRIEGAKKFLLRDLNVDLFANIEDKERSFLEEQFLKRHVITHNLGLVDKKYIERAMKYEKYGKKLVIKPADVLRAIDIVGIIVNRVIKTVTNKDQEKK